MCIVFVLTVLNNARNVFMNVGYIPVSGISECNFQCFARLLSIEVYQLIFPAQMGYRTFFLGILPFSFE